VADSGVEVGMMRRLKKELWPYCVPVNHKWSNDITTVEIWLGQKFGTFKDRWNVVTNLTAQIFIFENNRMQHCLH